ncbi:MAG: glycosyltransferase [Polaribacter sp.]
MPVFNNLKGLKKTVESIKNQTFTDFEVWIIDGKSSEETQIYLQKLTSPFYYQSEKDKGIYDAMNKGITLSKGNWLYFLGSGDVLNNKRSLEDTFSNSIPKNASLIASKIVYKGTTKPFIHSKKKIVKTPSWSFSIWLRNSLHHQGTFYKREVFLDDRYPLEYPVLSDYWFNLLLFKKRISCYFVDQIIAICNADGVSKSGTWKIYKEEVRLKINHSSVLFSPLFYSIVFVKFVLRKFINGQF